jgi:hypothetical protein
MSDTHSPITFKESIEMGKYDEEYLNQYPEWRDMDRQIRFQYITQAVNNRRKQLRLQWAKLSNQLDFSKKPHLAAAQRKVEQALRDLNEDEELLLVEYAGS